MNCSNCHQTVDITERFETDSLGYQVLCPRCLAEGYEFCPTCDTIVTHGQDCPTCQTLVGTCSNCGARCLLIDDLCAECLENSRTCAVCGTSYIGTEEFCSTECERRYYLRRNGNSAILNYSTRVSYPSRGDKPHYGVELEIELQQSVDKVEAAGLANSILNNFGILKSDSSIQRGFEVVTVPASLDAHREFWPKFYKEMRAYMYKEPRDNGMHVHIDKPTLLTEMKIFHFLNNLNNLSFLERIAGRSPTNYCRRADFNITRPNLTQQELEYLQTKLRAKPTFGKGKDNRNKPIPDRNYSRSRNLLLNTSTSTGKTIEIRAFAPPPNSKLLLMRLEFCHALQLFALQTSIKNLDVHNFVKFLQTLKGVQYVHNYCKATA